MRAEFVVPDVELVPSSKLDFGEILTTQRKSIFLRIRNVKKVEAAWSLRVVMRPQSDQSNGVTGNTNKIMSTRFDRRGNKGRWQQQRQSSRRDEELDTDGDVFVPTPCRGVVKPGEYADVEVLFCPKRGRSYKGKIVARIRDNPRPPASVTLRGVGSEFALETEPSVVQVPAALTGTERIVDIEIKNPTSPTTGIPNHDGLVHGIPCPPTATVHVLGMETDERIKEIEAISSFFHPPPSGTQLQATSVPPVSEEGEESDGSILQPAAFFSPAPATCYGYAESELLLPVR
eukprot:GHVU01210043.1.p2 GENE.GHVU01210043.1~~GHVU01210043.1.p2  ORF type:complete len:289 (+),score=38.63 GHVU01210043.1:2667-3533(+)